MKIGCVLILSILLSACGQTGPLYMPGTATGVHKKDEFVLGNSQSDQKKTPATKNKTKSAVETTQPAAETVMPTADATTSSDTSSTQSADNSTVSNEDSVPLGAQNTAPPGTVQ